MSFKALQSAVNFGKGKNMKEKEMKRFDVKAIDPETNRPCTFKSVGRDRLFQNESGETRFRYNYVTDCEVIEVKEVPQSELDAMASYFNTYGTANE